MLYRKGNREEMTNGQIRNRGLNAYLAFNSMLCPLRNNPFDVYAQKTWAYGATTYGSHILRYRPDTTTAARTHGRTQYHEAVFPYLSPNAYNFSAINLMHICSSFVVNKSEPQCQTRVFSVIFSLINSLLVYHLLKRMKAHRSGGHG